MIRIESPYFVAGVVFSDSTVTRSAPIVKYMQGWKKSDVIKYCIKKAWKFQWIP